MDLDLDNLSKDDFIEMAKYVHSMELQVQELKAYCVTLATQRNSAERKFKELQEQSWKASEPIAVKLNEDVVLTNPEQYRIKKQF
jgi:hypothetical protein